MKSNYYGRVKKMEKKGLRIDGRKFEEFREISFKDGISNKAEGSVQVNLGETEVMVGVKLGLSEPYSDTPKNGNLMVTAEITAMSGEEYEPGRPTEFETALARVVDRGIRESGAIDLSKLCIKEGEKVYQVFIDAYVINDDGNLLDASAMGALRALKQAKLPKYDEENDELDYENLDGELPLNFEPVAVTIAKVDDLLLVDPTRNEMEASDAKLIVTMNEKDRIVSLQKEGTGGFTTSEIKECFKIATKHSKKIRELVNK